MANPKRFRYCSWADWGAIPSISAESKLNTAMVPSDETAYSVRPSVDLSRMSDQAMTTIAGISPAQVHDLSLEDILGDYEGPWGFRLPNRDGPVIGTKRNN